MSELKRLDQNARRSRAIVHDGKVYLSGQVADDRNTGIREQAAAVLQKIDDLLTQAGTDRSRLLWAQVWLKTMEDFAAFNEVWDAWVVPGQTPARCCGRVELNDSRCLVEITAIAAI